MFKNLTFISVAAIGVFAASPAVMAADTAVVLWEGEHSFGQWENNLIVDSEEAVTRLHSAKEGDKVVVELNLSDDAQLKVACHATSAIGGDNTDGWVELAAQYEGLNSSFELLLDADMAGTLQSCTDLFIQGQYATVTKVSYVIAGEEEIPDGPVVEDGLWQGSHSFNYGGWGAWGADIVIPAEVFASLESGDRIVMTYADWNVEFQSQYLYMSGDDWAKMPGNGYFESGELVDGKYEFTPSNVVVNAFRANGMKVDGHDGKLVKVEVIHAVPVEIPEAGGTSTVNRWTGEVTLGEEWIHFPAEVFSKMPVGDNVIITVELVDAEAEASLFFARRTENGIVQVVNTSVQTFESFKADNEQLLEGKYIQMRPNENNVKSYREYGLYLRGSNLKILRIELVPEQVPAGYTSVFIHSTWWTLGWDVDNASELHPDWGKFQNGAVDNDPENKANYFKAGMHPLHIDAGKFRKVQENDVVYIRFAWWDEEHAPEIEVYVGDVRESLIKDNTSAKAAPASRAASGDMIDGIEDEGTSSRKKLVLTSDVAAALRTEGITIQGRNADIDHVRLLAKDRTTGVEGIVTEIPTDEPAEIYTIDGRRVDVMLPGNIYIVRCGNEVNKVIAR